MTNEQVCKYVKHYIEKDKTKSAIMLTAPWGKGKSYFLQNELIPYLEANGNYQSVVVSLYGVGSLAEISKSIYFEVKGFEIKNKLKRTKGKFEKITKRFEKSKVPSELIPAAKVAAGTVIRGITSFVDVDLSLGNLQELYSSIDLSGKLLVFEDIERSQIDIIEFLGYVNSIVEQDGVKVLLISNEDELIQYVQKEVEENGKKKLVNEYTESSLQYLKVKEKTISDTLHFKGDIKNAAVAIMKQYNCAQFDCFCNGEQLADIEWIFENASIDNLRTFTFACQKTFEIYEQISEYRLEDKYLECIFYGIILFSRSIKCGTFPEWNGTEYLSSKLTGSAIPLFRFCYEYIRWHEFDKHQVGSTIKAYNEYMALNQRNDSDLDVIFNYHISTEVNVLAALKSIDNRLDKPYAVPLGMYGRLAYHLVKLHFLLEYNFSSIRKKMINNLKSNGQKVDIQGLMLRYFEFETDEEKVLFENFKKEIEESIKSSQEDTGDFSYNPTEINVLQKKADSITRYSHRFISLYDLEKLIDMLFMSTAQQIDDFRGVMFTVYRNAMPDQFEREDCKLMESMVALIDSKKEAIPDSFDKIQLLQINYLCDNLRMFIKQLS